jgi:hypothetical protein
VKPSVICKKRVLLIAGITGVAGLLSIAGIFCWYSFSGMPETLFGRQRSIVVCLSCGENRFVCYTSVFDNTLFITRRKGQLKHNSGNSSFNRCTHLFGTIYLNDVDLELASLSIRRSTFGNADTDFWKNPVLIEALDKRRSISVEHSLILFSELNRLRQRAPLPEDINRSLQGTDSSELTQLLVRSYEKRGKQLPKLRPINSACETPHIRDEKAERVLFAFVDFFILAGALLVFSALLLLAGRHIQAETPRKKQAPT